MNKPESKMPDVAQWWPEIETKVTNKLVFKARVQTAGVFVASVMVAVLGTAGVFRFLERDSLQISGSPSRSIWLPSEQIQEIAFSDKSQITLQPKSELRLLGIAERNVDLQLKTGRAKFSVTPGGPRKWSIETSLVHVQVIGTEFFVDAREHQVVVQVQHGIVSVSGTCVKQGEQRLTQGQELVVSDDCLFLSKPIQKMTTEIVPSLEKPTVPNLDKPVKIDSKSIAQVPDVIVATPENMMEALTANQLLSDAESLRRLQQFSKAIERCEQILRLYPSTHEASLAAFLAGKIAQESLQDWAKAGFFFEKAVQLKLDSALQNDSIRRSMENYERAGMTEESTRMKALLK